MTQLALALAIIAGMVLVVGVFSQVLKKSPLQEPLIAFAVGIGAGPYGFGWLDIASWAPMKLLLEHTAQIALV